MNKTQIIDICILGTSIVIQNTLFQHIPCIIFTQYWNMWKPLGMESDIPKLNWLPIAAADVWIQT